MATQLRFAWRSLPRDDGRLLGRLSTLQTEDMAVPATALEDGKAVSRPGAD